MTMDEMKGRICVVTGSNSGIGKETALGLAKMGANVVMVVRNQQKGEAAKAEIIEKSGDKSIDLMLCDLSSMKSIKNFANEFKAKYSKLNVLINNAGAQLSKRELTEEGFERNLAVDYLGPFLLTHELLNLLKAGAPSRVINITSGLHKSGKVDLNDLQSERKYNGMQAYRNAKLMLIMFTYELAERLKGTGVSVNTAMPGFVATNLGKNSGSAVGSLMFSMVRPMQISASEGADTSIYLASSPEVEGVTGRIFKERREVSSAPLSYDQSLRKQLWVKTEEMLSAWL
jgi:NAD(P)-dependent dehydrogenase (short-subunit alcohol dehydrogenase family)